MVAFPYLGVIQVRFSTTEYLITSVISIFFFGATAPIWPLAYLYETLRFTSVF
jgi:hypothetical protein